MAQKDQVEFDGGGDSLANTESIELSDSPSTGFCELRK